VGFYFDLQALVGGDPREDVRVPLTIILDTTKSCLYQQQVEKIGFLSNEYIFIPIYSSNPALDSLENIIRFTFKPKPLVLLSCYLKDSLIFYTFC
jgi:hypothetical protein